MPGSPAARAPDRHRCASCGVQTPRWLGRCPRCQAWGTLAPAQVPAAGPRAGRTAPAARPPRPLTEVDPTARAAFTTGLGELDRVLGGGLVPGSVLLLAGEPGVGKSTLLLEVARRVAGPGRPVLVVSAEESAAQVRLRAERIGALSPHVLLAAETDLAVVLGHAQQVDPALLVVDSVQTVAHPDVDGPPGSITQVRDCAAALTRLAKATGTPTILVGHVTKDGSIAGPRLLEHLVDVVLHVEGDRHATLRVVRSVKNRYGPTDEIGCFELAESGLLELPDPSGLFLSRSGAAAPVPGTCATVTLEGRRPLVSEVQALVAGNGLAAPRRGVSGLDSARAGVVLAVVDRRAGVVLRGSDVHLATVGGARLSEPAADLAIAVAVVSAATDRAGPRSLVAIGEVGLAGDLRPVPGLPRRLAEAARLGFSLAVVPAGGEGLEVPGLQVRAAADLRAALRAAGLPLR